MAPHASVAYSTAERAPVGRPVAERERERAGPSPPVAAVHAAESARLPLFATAGQHNGSVGSATDDDAAGEHDAGSPPAAGSAAGGSAPTGPGGGPVQVTSALESAADRFARSHGAPTAPTAATPAAPTAPSYPLLRSQSSRRTDPASLGPGEPLSSGRREEFEARLGRDLGSVRVHQDTAGTLTGPLDARAFTQGSDIVLGPDAPAADSPAGRSLLAHELAHVDQQARGLAGGQVQLQHRDAGVPVAQVPDDPSFERGVDREAERRNAQWSAELRLDDVALLRDYRPPTHPHAYANRVRSAQLVLRDAGVLRVEDRSVRPDGVLGPRTFLAILSVARSPTHAARAQLQGLGFDLDAFVAARRTELLARAYARPAQTRLQLDLHVLGEAAVRYYDRFYAMRTLEDQSNVDELLFQGHPPGDLRREDRVQILQRLFGTAEQRLAGTLEIIVADRDFIDNQVDVDSAVGRDRRRSVDRGFYFSFTASSPDRSGHLLRDLDLEPGLRAAVERRPEADRPALLDALRLFASQTGGPPEGARQAAGVVVALYLPVPESARVQTAMAAVLADRAERERVEREAVAESNRTAARQRADILVALLDDDHTDHLIVDGRLRTELERAAREREFFDGVLDELTTRGRFERLFERIEQIGGTMDLGLLIRASLAGRYSNHPRVRQAQRLLMSRTGELRSHAYVVDPGADPTRGAVLLDGTDRVAVGHVVGDVNDRYLRDEDREQLKPASQRRMTAALETASRDYVEGLLSGRESSRTQEDVGLLLIRRAWTAAGLTEDEDIEDVTWEESIRVLGVRRGRDEGDGVPHWEIEYERVQRIRGGLAGTPTWDASPGVAGTRRWGTESEFELDLFWYAYSQSADVIQAAAKVVVIGSLIAVAWEAGVIGWLVSAAGGAGPVAGSILASLAIFMLTHHRWTLEGLLIAGVEGYLGALGFRLFAPVGAAAGRLVLPATLEEITFRRAVAAWVVSKGVTGGLVGGSLGVASVFMHDLIRVASVGGGMSSLSAYAWSAGLGVLCGAVFEIGGSILLAPLFRNADSSVLARVDDVVATLNGTQPRVTPAQWMANVGRGLSATRQMLQRLLADAQARTLYEAIAERIVALGQRWMQGARANIHRSIIELAGADISREALNGLERLVRVGGAQIGDDAIATILQQSRANAQRIDPWLRFLAGLDDSAVEGLAGRGQLRPLVDAEQVMALAGRRSSAEVIALLGQRFGHQVGDLEAFAARANRLAPATADQVLNALATRGTGVTPRALLRAAEAGEAIDDQLLGGLQRLLQGGTDPARLDAVLEALAAEQIGPLVRGAHTADAGTLTQMRELVANFEAAQVAWALHLPVGDAHALLNALDAPARAAIADITAAEAQALIAALTPARVRSALRLGAAGPLRGSHLRSLRTHWNDNSINDLLDWATNPTGNPATRLPKVARLAAGFEAAPADLLTGGPMAASSLVLDSNAVAGLNLLLNGRSLASLDEPLRDAIAALRRERGLGAYADPVGRPPTLEEIVGPNADLRVTPTTAAELSAELGQVGRSALLGRLRGTGSARHHADYDGVVTDLTSRGIGGAKGAQDRTIIADALLTPGPAGATPTLLTGDRGVLTGLASRYGDPVRFVPGSGPAWPQFLAQFPDGWFTVTIGHHPLRVIYR